MTAAPVLSTGHATLDDALGIGGLPTGRVIEYAASDVDYAKGLAMDATAAAQVAGKVVAWIDHNHDFEPDAATDRGVVLSDLLVSQPSTPEEAYEIALQLLRSGAVDLVVLASPPSGDGNDAWGNLRPDARLLSLALRKLTGVASRSGATMLFVTDGKPAGNALKYYSSVRVRLGLVEAGFRAKVIKNKLATPFTTAIIDPAGANVPATD